MQPKKIQFIIVGGAAAIVLLFFLIFKGILPGLQKKEVNVNKGVEGTLAIWGMYDDESALKGAKDAFEGVYPNLDISYRKFTDFARYESELVEALAVRRGPDIFMISNRGLNRHREKIAFAPQSQISLLSLRNLFPRVVEDDFTEGGRVGALPLSIDTPVLIYNRNILNQAGIVYPPTTWEDLEAIAPRLVKRDAAGGIIQASVALGGSPDTIARAVDIVELLALQDAAKEGRVVSGSITGDASGARALDFYKQFGTKESPLYTWNETMPYSLDAFGAGRVAMILGYSSDLGSIKARTNFIEPMLAKAPQKKNSENPVTLANYWGYTVSNQSPIQGIAWQFIIMLTTNERVAQTYAKAGGKPPALNSLIQAYLNDPKINILAEQALIARSIKTPDERREKENVEQAIRSAIR